MKKTTLLMVLSMILAIALGVGSTMAYLQDTDEDVNVMTLGNVYITQNEQEYNEAGELVPFTQDKPMFPAVGTPAWNVTDNSTKEENAWRQFTGLENVVDKYVTVTNTGKSDAYVRTLVALEMGELDINAFAGVFGLSVNKADGDEFDFPGTWEIVDDAVYTINGKTYNVMTFEHQNALVPGETTIPSILQMYLKGEATTNETMEKIDGNGNGKYDVLVLSQAVQTQGFADADTALNTAFGEINQANVREWFANIGNNIGSPGDKNDTNNPPVVPENAVVVSSNEELAAALTADVKDIVVSLAKDVSYDVHAWMNGAMGGDSTETVTIYGNGNTITFNLKDSDWCHVVTNNDAKLFIKDAVIKSSGYNTGHWKRNLIRFGCEVEMYKVTTECGISFEKDATIANSTINGTDGNYAMWICANGQNVELKKVTINNPNGRAIKIADEDADALKVTLSVADSKAISNAKAAILVTNVGGADITLSNFDISEVAADTINEVWVDEDRAAYADQVTVTGGTAVNE